MDEDEDQVYGANDPDLWTAAQPFRFSPSDFVAILFDCVADFFRGVAGLAKSHSNWKVDRQRRYDDAVREIEAL
jgi:hypothetical protein